MKKFVLMMMTAILLCSCGLTNITTPNSVALNEGNFKFVKTVTAETPSLYVFCIGGLSSRATADVVEKLKTVAQLQPNQALADIRIKTTTKVWVFGIVITRKLTATASVVEFVDAETNSFNNSANSGVQNASSHLSHDVTTNVIFDRTLMDRFLNGTIAKIEKKSESRREELNFQSEIQSNIETARELDEVSFIREKILAFEQYNNSLEKPKLSIVKNVEGLRLDLIRVEKKIKVRLKREAKKAAKKGASSEEVVVTESQPSPIEPVEVALTSQPEDVVVTENQLSPLELCRSGEIKLLPKNQQNTIFLLLVNMFTDRYRSADTVEELNAIASDLLVVRMHYSLMSIDTKADVDALYANLQRKVRMLSKKKK